MADLYKDWIGKTHHQVDYASPSSIERFCATIGISSGEPSAKQGAAMKLAPLGFHWCLCLPNVPQNKLGVDGHPEKGGFLPPVEAPRRMWASSKVKFLAPLPSNSLVERVQTIQSVNFKEGKTGPLYFVNVDHAISADGVQAIWERQTIVYREAGIAPELPKADASIDLSDWTKTRSFVPDEALLFRFSALTFNAHRIHYDLQYARGREDYPALVVQGPLTATLLLHHGATLMGDKKISAFEFTGRKPAFCNHEMTLVARQCDEGVELAALNSAGEKVMTALLTLT